MIAFLKLLVLTWQYLQFVVHRWIDSFGLRYLNSNLFMISSIRITVIDMRGHDKIYLNNSWPVLICTEHTKFLRWRMKWQTLTIHWINWSLSYLESYRFWQIIYFELLNPADKSDLMIKLWSQYSKEDLYTPGHEWLH